MRSEPENRSAINFSGKVVSRMIGRIVGKIVGKIVNKVAAKIASKIMKRAIGQTRSHEDHDHEYKRTNISN
jgi:hypothetical protein